jgi:hypothetical protein
MQKSALANKIGLMLCFLDFTSSSVQYFKYYTTSPRVLGLGQTNGQLVLDLECSSNQALHPVY